MEILTTCEDCVHCHDRVRLGPRGVTVYKRFNPRSWSEVAVAGHQRVLIFVRETQMLKSINILSYLQRNFESNILIRGRVLALFVTSCLQLSCAAGLRGDMTSHAVDAQTLTGKLIMGYQGWFGCPSDEQGGQWMHWFAGNESTVDMLPEVSELPSQALCPTPLFAADGKQIQVYSSVSPGVTDLHFAWMEKYGIDGVALQRFGTILTQPKLVAKFDAVLDNVRRSAEVHHRVFFVMYDLSGLGSTDLSNVERDWEHLEALGVTKSKAYLRHRGHPLLGLWGLGFAGHPLTPESIKALIAQLKGKSVANGGLTIFGGVPAGWRSGTRDAAPGWSEIWPMLGVISPWTVGRYVDEPGVDSYRVSFIEPDLAESRRIGVDYMPVVFPGFSWSNLMRARKSTSPAPLNGIPRHCGQFYWKQIVDALGAGSSMIYGAMFDEVDEGTAMYKTLPAASQVPGTGTLEGEKFLTLDADGCRLPSDWYLRLAGEATKYLHDKQVPPADLPLSLP
jgi:hypothetical protein